MNKTAIKNFAIWARNKLIADISYRAGLMGITADGIKKALPQSTGMTEFYDIGTFEPYAIAGDAVKQRNHLVDLIRAKERETNYKTAYKYVIEEVAYTWFNRLIAVRFMEVNDYLPSHIRVLSSDSGKMEPDLVTTPFDAELSFTRDEEQMIYQLKQENKIDEVFRILFIKQCNALNGILPALFEKTSDYTELLLNLSVIDQDGVVYHLVHDIPEEDFDVERGGQVEIIGWLYQYYNTEPKNEAFAKKGKISKEEIPAVTQLFTPDWIVRYMVENSVGRLWIEHLRALDESADEAALAASFGWKYYLPEAKQEPEVEEKLRELRKERASLTPEQITMIDPCMGSGHILVYGFSVLMQIYENAGYGQRDAAKSILENNLFGLDIDDRAYQMAYFAVMMKARGYNRRILNGENSCKVYAIQESNGITDAALGDMGANLSEEECKKALKEIKALIGEFKDAKEYGSILNIEKRDWDLLRRFAVPNVGFGQLSLDMNGAEVAAERLQEIIDIAELMENKYSVTCTNPPYMGSGNMGGKLSSYVRTKYYDSRADLFAVFIERCQKFSLTNHYYSMITQHAWMFLESFEALRGNLNGNTIINMAHLGPRAFDEIGGEIVQTTAFTMCNHGCPEYTGTYMRLVNEGTEKAKEQAFLCKQQQYLSTQKDNHKIPGMPIAYWITNELRHAFEYSSLVKLGDSFQGIITGDVNRFLRVWSEINYSHITFNEEDYNVLSASNTFYPYIKGGSYRKWGGNQAYVLRWHNNGSDLVRSRTENRPLFFKEGITWSLITTTELSFRWVDKGFLCDVSGSSYYTKSTDKALYVLAFLNTKVSSEILHVLNPTMNINVRDILLMPLKEAEISSISLIAKDCIQLSKKDWNSFETSWDFQQHPLAPLAMEKRDQEISQFAYSRMEKFGRLSWHYEKWEKESQDRFEHLKENEEELNRIFIDIYGLQNELTPEVDDKNVTIRKANLQRDIKSLLSYVIGCMFGRYSLDVEGLAYAGGDWDKSKYTTFLPDTDNVIPITDEEYLEDDIVSRLCTWLKVVYGESTLEKNLDFIAKALGNKGSSSREIIRNYFLNDFFKDHCQTYSVTGSGKRPIYWLFDSGKQNGFKALIYLHRYNANTIGNLRIDYLHRMQRIYESEISRMQDFIDHSTSAREVAQATKRREKLQKQLKECREYDEKLAHLALSRIELDLDDGVKVNYRKIQTASDGKFYEVLADSKNIMAKK